MLMRTMRLYDRASKDRRERFAISRALGPYTTAADQLFGSSFDAALAGRGHCLALPVRGESRRWRAGGVGHLLAARCDGRRSALSVDGVEAATWSHEDAIDAAPRVGFILTKSPPRRVQRSLSMD